MSDPPEYHDEDDDMNQWYAQRYEDEMYAEHAQGHPESDPRHCWFCGEGT